MAPLVAYPVSDVVTKKEAATRSRDSTSKNTSRATSSLASATNTKSTCLMGACCIDKAITISGATLEMTVPQRIEGPFCTCACNMSLPNCPGFAIHLGWRALGKLFCAHVSHHHFRRKNRTCEVKLMSHDMHRAANAIFVGTCSAHTLMLLVLWHIALYPFVASQIGTQKLCCFRTYA
eukprot:649846-Amphidinium_carterae.1